MTTTPRICGLIPARGGSKGIPRKNIRAIAGKPLIAWTIEAALSAKVLDTVVVTTEDEEIATVARRYGAQVPFMRPAELAHDATPGVDPVLHAIGMLPGHDAFVLLQPTSPLRTASDIEECVAFARARDANSVVSVCATATHPFWMYRLDSDAHMTPLLDAGDVTRRQDAPALYALNGALYYARAGWLLAQRRFVTEETLAWVMPPERSTDVDTLHEWEIAEFLLNKAQRVQDGAWRPIR